VAERISLLHGGGGHEQCDDTDIRDLDALGVDTETRMVGLEGSGGPAKIRETFGGRSNDKASAGERVGPDFTDFSRLRRAASPAIWSGLRPIEGLHTVDA
jgi:hypothetical protein